MTPTGRALEGAPDTPDRAVSTGPGAPSPHASRLQPPLGRTGRTARGLRLIAAWDPGLAQLTTATRTALSIALALVAEWAFVGATHALQVAIGPHAAPAAVAAAAEQHHEVLVVAMLLGALVSNLQGINGNELTVGPQMVTITYIGVVVAASLALGLAIGPHRELALVVMVVLLVVGSAGRRFGQRGAVAGLLLFIGYFYGFFLSSGLGVAAAGWLAAEVGVATFAAVVVRLALFRPSPARDLRLAMATYDARVRTVLALAAGLATGPDEPARRRIQRWLVRLGEAALIVDGQLARGATSGADADEIHRRVFDTDVAVTNLARFAEMLGNSDITAQRRNEVRQALDALAAVEVDRARRVAAAVRSEAGPVPPTAAEHTLWVLHHRFANALDAMAEALARWPSATIPGGPVARDADGGGAPAFAPAVTLRGGLLPGSADVSVEASANAGSRVRVAPYVRTAAQMAVAVSIAIVAGDALDAQRFYWAVVAALLALVGTNTVAEQLRKATYRIAGTLAGIVVGTALVDAVGHHSAWSLVTVVVVMWIGVLFMRANYAILALAVTTSLSQAYLSLGEFSNGLLWERLAETAVGAAAAMVTVLVVAPLRTRRVLEAALANLVEAVADLATLSAALLATGHHTGALHDTESQPDGTELRGAGRAVDAAFQAVVATAQPLRLVGWTDSADRVSRQIAAATAARNYARNLVADTPDGPRVNAPLLNAGREVLCDSAGRLAARLRGEAAHPSYLRSAGLFSEADCSDDQLRPDGAHGPTEGPISSSLAIRDLVLLDNALAALASATGLAVVRPAPEVVVGAGALPGPGGRDRTQRQPPRGEGPE